MVKVGGKRNTQKVCKKQVNFLETGVTFLKVGGQIRNLWSMTKKRSSNILADENQHFFRKR